MLDRAPSQPGNPAASGRGFVGLIEELLGHLVQFLDQKLILLRLELEENLGSFARHAVTIAMGAAIAGLGLLLTGIALSLWIARFVGSLTAGFALTGGGFLVIGAVVVVVRVRRGLIPQRHLLPDQTTTELRADARWLKNGL
jgi:uncharacterized membrane protein YqjE